MRQRPLTAATRGIIGLLALLLLGASAHAAKAPAGIPWQSDYRAALSRAQQGQRPVFLDFYADWCGPCQEMAKTTFRDPQVVQVLKQMECVRINADSRSSVIAQYHVVSIPRMVVLNPKGKVVMDLEGYTDAQSLLAMLRGVGPALGKVSLPAGLKVMPPRPTGPDVAPEVPKGPTDPVLALGDPDRDVRDQAAATLRAKGKVVVPRLLNALDHPQLGVRLGATRLLKDMAHPPAALRYDPWAGKAQRAKSAKALKDWWQKQHPAH